MFLDEEIVTRDKQHGGLAWTEEATVWTEFRPSSGSGVGNNDHTTGCIGIRFDDYDYDHGEADDGNCHNVAANRIHLLVNEHEIDEAIASIQDAFRSTSEH